MNNTPPESLWTKEEASRYLAISANTLMRHVREGKLSVVQLNRLVRFRPDDVRAYGAGGSQPKA